MRYNIILISYLKLLITTIIVSLLSILLADSLKMITGHYETQIFKNASHFKFAFFILPSVGITLIYFLRKYLFKGKQNKGIKEIYTTISNRKNELPTYKIPSHYFNGFLTVIFGGSTGVEVSTVVATAAVGATAHKKGSIANIYKTELITAGVAAGIATLFGSPLAGFLFAIEIIARKISKTIVLSSGIAAGVSWFMLQAMEGEKLFKFSVAGWKMEAIPYFVLLSIISGFVAVYFTKLVIFTKARFAKINNNFIRVNVGAILVGIAILFFPQLYGDSYHALPALINKANETAFSITFACILLTIVLLKPLVASLTLGAGGDGGVFAPSIVTGAVLGMLVALVLNHYFSLHLIVINFALVGAAAMLSAAIDAPLTSLFLTCGLVAGGYSLFIPILLGSFIAKYAAQWICGYTVYSYQSPAQTHKRVA
ncbi:MAG: chloride channel protein [Sphingobacteriales bacterium]|uniref:chloride channel protein n=1 Tax=Hydrotalea flava TaxID=714549 RepID=UPI0008360F2C|nr:chloride channel protein [Hydrotalea flava]RTL49944.1 MAG: chloride channel protein [Sphingobacteriales bacterium]